MTFARGLLAVLLFASGAALAQSPPEPESVEVFEVVEQNPELIGGIAGLQRRVEYPELARRAGVEGRVFIQFIVDEQGKVQDAVCVRSPDELLCEAASRAVRESRFRPGMQDGRTVKVRFTLPVDFRLRSASDDLEMDLRDGPKPPPPPPSVEATPSETLPFLLGSAWSPDLFADLPPPRSGRVKGGAGALVFGDPAPDIGRLVAHVADGVYHALDVYFLPVTEGTLRSMRDNFEQQAGAPDADGFFSPDQTLAPFRLRISPESTSMRFEATELEPPPPPPSVDERRAPPPRVPPASGEPEIFEVVEQNPELIGGLPGLQERVVYPEDARAEGVEGRVFVQFVVDASGAVSEPECARSPDERLCAAAIDAIRRSTFRPAMQRGRPVKVRFTLPVDFRLQ